MITKVTKKISVLLIIIVMVFCSVSSVSSKVAAGSVTGAAGQVVTVEFKYSGISGINGEFTYTNSGIFSDIALSTTGLTSGMYNPANNKVAYFGPSAVDCTIKLTLTISKKAAAGQSCKITFKYETTSDGNMPSEPEYKYDSVTVVVKAAIDYSELKSQIAKVEALNKNSYTKDSWVNLEAALASAKVALSSDNQTTVNNAAAALADAINALKTSTPAPSVDYTELRKQISIAEGLNESEYTIVTWARLQTALSSARSALASSDQTTVDNAAIALKNAIASLMRASAPVIDFSELKKQIKIAGDLNEEDYTAASWNKLETALKNANGALNSQLQTTVDNAAAELKNAISSLVKISSGAAVNYTELNRQIAIAEGLKKEDFTAQSWSAMEKALATARVSLHSGNQNTVDSAARALAQALAALKRLEGAAIDYSELNRQIAIAEGLDENEYTAATWAEMQKTLVIARSTLTSKLQSEVDLVAAELKEAIANLKTVDYTVLLTAIENARKYEDAIQIPELWETVQQLLPLALKLLESRDQEAIDQCAEQLNQACQAIIDHLETLKGTEVVIESPVPVVPDNYCSISMHRVWPVLFLVSLAVNLAIGAMITFYFIQKKKLQKEINEGATAED